MILILSNANKTYFHIVHLNGQYGIAELVDDTYRAEHYDSLITNHSVNDIDYWEDASLFHDGTFDSLGEAILAVVDGFDNSDPYFNNLINEKSIQGEDDWLITVGMYQGEEEVDGLIQDWVLTCKNEPFFGRSDEYYREAEYYEIYEPDNKEAMEACYKRSEYLASLGRLMIKE